MLHPLPPVLDETSGRADRREPVAAANVLLWPWPGLAALLSRTFARASTATLGALPIADVVVAPAVERPARLHPN